MLRPVLITPPAVDVVSLEEAKAELRLDFAEDDARVQRLVRAATQYFDGASGVLGRCLINQTWRAPFPCWPASRWLMLPFPDVSSVTVTYFDPDDAEQTVSASEYTLTETDAGSAIRFKDTFFRPSLSDDRPDAVRVELIAGFGDAADDVPEPVRAAILMLVCEWFDGAEGAASDAVAMLSAPWRRIAL